jgi:hypothetical protein
MLIWQALELIDKDDVQESYNNILQLFAGCNVTPEEQQWYEKLKSKVVHQDFSIKSWIWREVLFVLQLTLQEITSKMSTKQLAEHVRNCRDSNQAVLSCSVFSFVALGKSLQYYFEAWNKMREGSWKSHVQVSLNACFIQQVRRSSEFHPQKNY